MSEHDTPTPTRKTALAPDLRSLDDRAARAWTERMAVRPLAGGRYAVDSQSGATYVVDLPDGDCTCPDHEIRGERCKHLRRVAIEVTAGRVPAPGRRAVACDACGTETFAPESADPPLLCGACDLDPGERVVDRETGDPLIVRRVTDRRADETRIEAADTTVADYPTNSAYPDDDLVVEVVYASDAASDQPRRESGDAADEQPRREDGDAADEQPRREDGDAASDQPRRYAFPLSRLEGHPVRSEDRDPEGRGHRDGSVPPLTP